MLRGPSDRARAAGRPLVRDARRETTVTGRARRRRYGQHFLEPTWVPKVVAAIDPAPAERFLEVGPGQGALTWALADRGAQILAIEIDRNLAASLAREARPAVAVITRDVLDCDLVELARSLAPPTGADPKHVRLVGNLPYSVSAPILLQVLRAYDRGAPLRDAVVMLQQEMAERVTAGPGTSAYGPLAVAVRLRATAERRLRLPPGAFRPAPAVHSAVVALRFRPAERTPRSLERFEALVRALFLQRRKQAGNAIGPFAALFGLAGADVFRRAGLDPRRRPGDLTLDELIELADVLVPDPD